MTGFLLICALYLFSRIQSRNNDVNDVCGIYGYNYNTNNGYFIGTSPYNDYISIYKYKMNDISPNIDSISMINAKEITRIKGSTNLCEYKSMQTNNEMYIINDKMDISMYNMDKEIYYKKYINVPKNLKCNIETVCLGSDNNENIYVVCGLKFYYYSLNSNKWKTGNNLNYNHTKSSCVYGNNRFHILDDKSEYIDVTKTADKNHFNIMENGSIQPNS